MKCILDLYKIDVLELQSELQKSQQEITAMQESKEHAEAQLQVALQEIEILKATSPQKIQAYHPSLGLAPK